MMVPLTHDGSNTFRSMYPDITAYGTRPGRGFNYSQSEKAYGDRLRSISSSIIQEPLGCTDGRRIIAITVTRQQTYMAQNLLRSFSASAEVGSHRQRKTNDSKSSRSFKYARQVLVNIGSECHFLWALLTFVFIAC